MVLINVIWYKVVHNSAEGVNKRNGGVKKSLPIPRIPPPRDK